MSCRGSDEREGDINVFGQKRRVWFTLVFSLALLLYGCGPSPTAPPVAIGAPETPTPTRIPPTLTTAATLSPSPTATPQPALEPVTSRFLYVEEVTVSTLAGDGDWDYRDGPGCPSPLQRR
jgi:hypothetical protein